MKQTGLLGLVGILTSCTVGAGSMPQISILATPATGAATAPVLTVTPSLRPSSALTNTPLPTPDVPLYDDGAWLLFQGAVSGDSKRDSHLWAVNWDGTGLTDLLPDFFVWQYEIQPSVDNHPGSYVAAITSYGWSDKFMFTLAHLPDGEVIADIPLTNSQTELVDQVLPDDPNYEDYIRRMSVSMSISDLRSLAWSPDGTQIAFSGAQDGTQADVYTYSLADNSISRLTRGQHPNHASNLLWSPDGRYIAYDDVSNFLTAYYWVDGIWMVRADGSTVQQIASTDEWPPTSAWGNRPQKLEWISDHTIAVDALMTINSNRYRLKQIDVETGTSSTVVEGEYCGAAFAPEKNAWLVEMPSSEADKSGAYLLQNGNMSKVGPLDCFLPIWSPDLDAFITTKGLVSIDGEQTVMTESPESLPLISPDGVYWAYPGIFDGFGSKDPRMKLRTSPTGGSLWIGEAGKQPQKLSDERFEVIQWSSNSRSVLVTNELVSDNVAKGLQYVAIAPDFKLRLISQYDTSLFLGPWWSGKAIGK